MASSMTRRSFLRRIGGFLASHWLISGLTAGGVGALSRAEYDTLKLEINEWNLYYPHLPSPLEGKSILHLSDLHLESLQISADRLNTAVSKFDPDLIVFTGDLISDRHDLDKVEPYLKSLKSRIGKYFVMGNNDYAHFSNALFTRYTELLERLGWTVLINDAVYLADLSLMIIGIDDPATARDDAKKAYAKGEVLKKEASDKGYNASSPFRLVLSHSTDSFDDARRCGGADLLLAGHTHGGQIRLPGFKPLVYNTYLGKHGYYEGYHIIGDIPVYINRGIGTSAIPLRLGARPEIALFTLRRGDRAGEKVRK